MKNILRLFNKKILFFQYVLTCIFIFIIIILVYPLLSRVDTLYNFFDNHNINSIVLTPIYYNSNNIYIYASKQMMISKNKIQNNLIYADIFMQINGKNPQNMLYNKILKKNEIAIDKFTATQYALNINEYIYIKHDYSSNFQKYKIVDIFDVTYSPLNTSVIDVIGVGFIGFDLDFYKNLKISYLLFDENELQFLDTNIIMSSFLLLSVKNKKIILLFYLVITIFVYFFSNFFIFNFLTSILKNKIIEFLLFIYQSGLSNIKFIFLSFYISFILFILPIITSLILYNVILKPLINVNSYLLILSTNMIYIIFYNLRLYIRTGVIRSKYYG